MENVILLYLAGVAGLCVLFYVQSRRARAGFELQITTLRHENDVLRQQALERQQDAARRRHYRQANSIADTQNQLRFIAQSELRSVRPVNHEAAPVLYALDDWIQANQRKWRFGFEVSMGAFIQVDSKDKAGRDAFHSYNSKRVDFLLIDRYGQPALVIEYHGSGHNRSDDAKGRMAVKRLVLERAGIPLLEVAEKTAKADILHAISERLGTATRRYAGSGPENGTH
jgi:hypothetical protein